MFISPSGGVPLGRSPWNIQWMSVVAKVPNAVEILPKIWTAWVGRTNVTDDRRTGDSIQRTFTFAKMYGLLLLRNRRNYQCVTENVLSLGGIFISGNYSWVWFTASQLPESAVLYTVSTTKCVMWLYTGWSQLRPDVNSPTSGKRCSLKRQQNRTRFDGCVGYDVMELEPGQELGQVTRSKTFRLGRGSKV